jgi:tryptophan-rich sensory protein
MMPETSFMQALVVGALFCVVLAVAGGLLTRMSEWYYALRKPSWKPPDWSFGPIWTIVFICLTLSIAYDWEAATAGQRLALLIALGTNGALNVAWSGIFFMMRQPWLAFLELVLFWLSIAAVMLVMAGISSTAVLLTFPYIIWVSAAGVLNYQIVRMNKT